MFIHLFVMNESEKQEITKIVLSLRSEIIKGSLKFKNSKNFPIGCCGNASEILERRLLEKGFYPIERKVNMWFNNQSHSWLVYKGYIIDITIDQFKTHKNLPFIQSVANSKFHKKFYKD